MPSKFSFGSEKSLNTSCQGSVAKLGFQPYKKTTFPEEVKEVQESPESNQVRFDVDNFDHIDKVSKQLSRLKIDPTVNQTMESLPQHSQQSTSY